MYTMENNVAEQEPEEAGFYFFFFLDLKLVGFEFSSMLHRLQLTVQ